MSNTIFTDDFPLITTSEELQQLFLKYPEYDEYYIASGSIQDRKAFFSEMWKDFEPYADPGFLFTLKQKGNFHQKSWEMYIGSILIKNGFVLQIKNNSEGPDVIVKNNNIYIECIAIEHGSGEDAVPKFIISKIGTSYSQSVPTEKIIMRITHAINEKLKQYNRWKLKQRFNSENGYIIATNSGTLGRPHNDKSPISAIIQSLFGFHQRKVNRLGETSFSYRNNMNKKNGAKIGLTYFCDDKYKYLSGIIFTDKDVLNLDKNKCVFINNPFAINPIPENLFNNMDQWKATKNTDGSLGIQYIPVM